MELAAEGELIKAIFDMHVFLLTLPKKAHTPPLSQKSRSQEAQRASIQLKLLLVKNISFAESGKIYLIHESYQLGRN